MSRANRTRSAWALALFLAVGIEGRADGALPPTHGMALDSVATAVAAELLQGVEIPPGRPVLLTAPAPGDTLGLVTQRLVERLKARGVTVRLTGPAAVSPGSDEGVLPGNGVAAAGGIDSVPVSFGGTTIEPRPVRLALQVDGSGVTYVRRIGSFPFGTKGYERLAAIRATATLLDPVSGEVFWTRSATRSASDLVRKGDVVYAASGSGRLNPPVPRGGGVRWLEPLIVVGVVAGLVVLFYSNRN